MKENQSSYRKIFKATSIFGGVQVFKILTSIIRSKIIAVLMGPAGMGVTGLLISTTALVGAFTNFGLGISSVRNIAAAYESGNISRISKVVKIIRGLVWVTGVLGAVITIVLSSWLSEITFGNNDYSTAFIWLSITLLFTQLTSGQNVLLQGMRKLNFLAKANLVGSAFGLLFSVPMYYYWRIDGIVPSLIVSSILSFVIAGYFSRQIKVENVEIKRQEAIKESKNMLKMGLALSLSSLAGIGSSFVIRIFISNTGGIEDVGLFTAGFAIVSSYVGLVFTAMGTDYYPRLSGVAHDANKSKLLINEQAEIGILILAPILAIFLIFINWIVVILYSNEFTPINAMIQWAALGMYFKLAGWCLGFLLLAKGVTRVFFWTELLASGYTLLLNIVGYMFYGLEGLGVSYLFGYIFYLIHIYLIVHIKYQFSFNIKFQKLFKFQLFIGLICLLIIKFIPTPWAYLTGLPFIIVSIIYSFIGLDKRIGIKNLIVNKFKK